MDRLSQYVSTISPNVYFVRGIRGREGRNVSSVTSCGRGGGRGVFRFGYGQGRGGIFGYLQCEGGRGGRGGCGGRGGRSGGRGGRGNHNNYNNNRSQNQNYGVDASNLTSNFIPEGVSALIQANVWDNIRSEQRAKLRRLNNNDDGDITARVNVLGSTIETLQDTGSRITDDQTNNGVGNNNGGNNNRGGNNNGGGNNNYGNNAQNGRGGGNNRSNSSNFGGGARRRGAFFLYNYS